jgi:FMN phosphatase YigB (HAD superfamily)
VEGQTNLTAALAGQAGGIEESYFMPAALVLLSRRLSFTLRQLIVICTVSCGLSMLALVPCNGGLSDGMNMTRAVRRAKAVLLDVDGTLYRQGPLRRRMAIELFAFAVLHPVVGFRTVSTLHTFRRMRESLRGTLPEGCSCEGLQYERPAKILGVAPQEVRQVVKVWMHERPLRHLRSCLRPGLARFLGACSKRGISVGALSDYPTHDKLGALGVLSFFGLELCSTSPGIDAFKPSPAGILSACRSWGLNPEEILVVGDRAEIDGEAARAAGAAFVLIGGAGFGTAARDFFDLQRIMGLDGDS